ncbi:hypothetical protein Hanom_Chr14g01263581 [Helianthus anomalus]
MIETVHKICWVLRACFNRLNKISGGNFKFNNYGRGEKKDWIVWPYFLASYKSRSIVFCISPK